MFSIFLWLVGFCWCVDLYPKSDVYHLFILYHFVFPTICGFTGVSSLVVKYDKFRNLDERTWLKYPVSCPQYIQDVADGRSFFSERVHARAHTQIIFKDKKLNSFLKIKNATKFDQKIDLVFRGVMIIIVMIIVLAKEGEVWKRNVDHNDRDFNSHLLKRQTRRSVSSK